VDEWKEQARNVTTYTTKVADPVATFTNVVEVERHFRTNHLPGLVRSATDLTVGGVSSRNLSDRVLGRTIEEAWVQETRSPSKMMQELVAGLRSAGLHIFRHRRGMLFVSPIRARPFAHESTGVSPSINRILEKIKESPGINLKQLAEQLTPTEVDSTESEKAKLSLASDLHWLVSEGYVIEFNDGSLDLPRVKPPVVTTSVEENLEARPETDGSEKVSPDPEPVAEGTPEVVETITTEAVADEESTVPAITTTDSAGA
jgi:hypothetical protein